jgi:hypothetical protein
MLNYQLSQKVTLIKRYKFNHLINILTFTTSFQDFNTHISGVMHLAMLIGIIKIKVAI